MPYDASSALKRNIAEAVLALGVIHLIGAFGYTLIGGGRVTLFDGFYMTFITVATIGYAEVVDMSGNVPGRLFTVAIAITGIGCLWVVFSNFTALLLARTMDPERNRAKMLKEVARMRDHFIVCGLGRIGANVARELLATRHPFVAVEPDEAAVEAFRQHGGERAVDVRILTSDAGADDTLQAAGIAHARGVFAVTGEDSQNMLIALTAKQLNATARVVARVHDVRNIEKCRRAGADEIVSPDFTGGLRIATAMLQPLASSFMDEMIRRSDALRLIDVPVPIEFRSRPLGDLELRAAEYLVIGVKSAGGWHFNPGPELELVPGATLIAMATPAGVGELQRLLRGGRAS
jgi:voltage-gated potassium channel